MKSNEGTKGFKIRFICELCRYEQSAYVNVKPIKFNLRLGAKFICNECQDKQMQFMDGQYNV